MTTFTPRIVRVARILTVLYAIAIVVLSLIPADEVPLESISDKYRHAAAYAGFAVLLGCSMLQWRWRAIPIAFVIASVVGIAMEILQPYFHRSRDVMDAVANSIGAAIGCALVASAILFVRIRQGRLSGPATNT